MYPPFEVENNPHQLKPMNCPFHILAYQSDVRSYRDLPLRWAELGTVYRYERSGVLHGLFRVRGFTQDDAHIFCRRDQVEEEIVRVLDFSLQMYAAFGSAMSRSSCRPVREGHRRRRRLASRGERSPQSARKSSAGVLCR